MRTIEYILEIFDLKTRRYIQYWSGQSIDWANRMYNKPYNRRHTRRLVKVSREVLFQDKANESK